MIKKCLCIRYLSLLAGRKNQSHCVFIDDELYPIESVFPLEDFEPETGELITICPYYNYVEGDKSITRAYDRILNREINTEHIRKLKKGNQLVPFDKLPEIADRIVQTAKHNHSRLVK